MAKIGEVCSLYAGTGFPVQYQGSASGEYPFYKVGDIAKNVTQGFKYLQLCENYIDGDICKIIKGTVIPANAIVFAKIGEAVKLNRRAITSVPCLIDNNAMGIKPDEDKVNLSYFYHFMCNLKLEQYAEATTVPSVKKTIVEKIDIPLPPLVTQKQIAATLDKATHTIDLCNAILEKLDLLVKARFVEMFEAYQKAEYIITVSEAIAKGIIEKPLDGNHGEKHPKATEYVEDGIPFLMANDIDENGTIDFRACKHITKERAEQLDKGFAKNGDVLITHKGTIGRTAILTTDKEYIMLTPQVTYYRIKKALNPYFLKGYFDSIYFQPIIQNIASVGSTRAYIGITAQTKLPLMIPPIELQEQFAAFVAQTDKTKAAVQQVLSKAETLKKALMQEYFG